MRLASKFFQLDGMRRRLLLIASFLELSFWFLLRILPFRVVRSFMEKLVARTKSSQPPGPELLPRIIWALSIASRRLLGKDTCLSQAMAARVLFSWCGLPAEIRFGVKKSAQGDLQAHAWVLNGNDILIGGEGLDLSSYTPLNHTNRVIL
jgi:Transglutaminase-like superfamily